MKEKSLIMLFAIAFIALSCKDNSKSDVVNKKEKYRPNFHFTPKANWMNDPNGMVYYNDTYHLFYQYYPDSTVWGPMHWGHAKSKDLLHWEHRPIALYPDSLGDIFSGSAVIDKTNTSGFGKDAMVAMFTYHDMDGEKEGKINFQTQGIAYSLDEGETWTKYKGNPVIGNPGIKDFRDPKVFWNEEKENWQMALVAKDKVIFYGSDDLKSWNKLSEFKFNDDPPLGVWECPDLFKLPVQGTDEEKWVLIISHGGNSSPNGGSGTRYFVGEYDGVTFTTNQQESQWIDYGTDNYAGVTYNNEPNNERIFIGWMSNWDYAITTPTKTWRSAMTLPRKLSLERINDKYILKSTIIDGFDSLLSNMDIENSDKYPFEFESEKLQHSVISFEVKINDKLEIELSNVLGDTYLISYDPVDGIFFTDRTNSGIVDFNKKFLMTPQQKILIGKKEKLKIELVLDASSIEIFLNEGEFVMTNQIFPKKDYHRFVIKKTDGLVIDNFKIQSVKSTL
ncbi:MAG: glycoside hydrolase family 32 protein [Bacteroidia bacterium]|nr:glycoside hydrolase family 32 protein [Bacteroidia bacterium]